MGEKMTGRTKNKSYVPAEGPLLKRARDLTWRQILAIAAIVLGVTISALVVAENYATPSATALAECLTASGWTVYGTPACPACMRQKEMFGGAWEHIYFVDCAEQAAECNSANITAIPTWVSPDGTRLAGVQTLETLAGAAGCAL